MDDDDYRRGVLTNHKVFGEATAILAGDALLVNAYELIASDPLLSDSVSRSLILLLAQCSGANGMIGGQQLDMLNEDQPLTIDQLMQIHRLKTGCLIEFALVGGGIIALKDPHTLQILKEIAHHIGIAFQIQDDILDVVGDATVIGKPIHSDEKNNKYTYVSLLGIEGAKTKLMNHYEQAKTCLKQISTRSSLLEELFKLIVERTK
jgi:geranylgeranyl diphosphate synthase, type II